MILRSANVTQLVNVFHENLPGAYALREDNSCPLMDVRVSQLPGRLQPVLKRLLKGDSEKQAALALGLSPHTIHEYVKTIYRAMGGGKFAPSSLQNSSETELAPVFS